MNPRYRMTERILDKIKKDKITKKTEANNNSATPKNTVTTKKNAIAIKPTVKRPIKKLIKKPLVNRTVNKPMVKKIEREPFTENEKPNSINLRPFSISGVVPKSTDNNTITAPSSPNFETKTTLSDMLLGASPALLGLLVGAPQAGFEQSSKLYGKISEMRQNDLNAMRSIASKRSTNNNNFEAWKQRKDYEESLIRSRPKLQVVKDAQGFKRVIDKNALDKGSIVGQTDTFEGQPLPPSWIKQGKNVESTFLKTAGKDIESLKNSGKAISLLYSGKPQTEDDYMSIRVALNMVPKITEARATDEDYNRTVNRISEIMKAANYAYEIRNDRVAKEKIDAALKLFNRIKGKVGQYNERFINKMAKSHAAGDKRKEKYFKNILSPYAIFNYPDKTNVNYKKDQLLKKLGAL